MSCCNSKTQKKGIGTYDERQLKDGDAVVTYNSGDNETVLGTINVLTSTEIETGTDINPGVVSPEQLNTAIQNIGGGGGSGEANTASNVGTTPDATLFKQKVGVDLQFNGVISTSNVIGISLNGGTNNIEYAFNGANITTVGTVTTGNVDAVVTSALITGKTTVTPVSGDFLLLSDASDSGNFKKVDAANFLGGGGGGEANTASNVGTAPDATIFLQKTGVDLEFNGLNSTNTLITVANNVGSNNIEFTFNQSNITQVGTVTVGNTDATITSALITGKTTETPVAGDFLLFSDTSDSGNLKKVDASDLLGGGGSGDPFSYTSDAIGSVNVLKLSGVSATRGGTIAGSNLLRTRWNASGALIQVGTDNPPGTWRCLSANANNGDGILVVRIS